LSSPEAEHISQITNLTHNSGADNEFQPPDFLRYCIGQIFFCKNSLQRILAYLKGDFAQMVASKQSVEALLEGPGWTRIGRYNQMLRYFVRFLQERAILHELANDYDYWFEAALGITAGQTKLPPGRPAPSKQFMQLNDFAAASRDLLLEGTTGRFASPPHIRAVIELALIRSFLELPKHSSKHKTKTIETTHSFRLADLMTACNKASVKVHLNPTNQLIEAIYRWGNETVHSGITYPMEQILYCHSIADDLANGRLGPMFSASNTQIDALLDALQKDGEIILK